MTLEIIKQVVSAGYVARERKLPAVEKARHYRETRTQVRIVIVRQQTRIDVQVAIRIGVGVDHAALVARTT